MNNIWESILNNEVDVEDIKSKIETSTDELEILLLAVCFDLMHEKKEINADNIFIKTKSQQILGKYMEISNQMDALLLKEKEKNR